MVNSSAVTIPKLPPPPRSAQNSSAFSASLAHRIEPSAVTTSRPVMLLVCIPSLRAYMKIPPPSE